MVEQEIFPNPTISRFIVLEISKIVLRLKITLLFTSLKHLKSFMYLFETT